MSTLQAALYARVSSEQQAEAHTIASQVSALKERAETDGVSVSETMTFLDEGYSGATLVRPALEHLRDAMSAGLIDRLYVHSPDRLARKYAYQVFLVEEFSRLGVEVVFLNRELGQSPEDDLLLQVQGMIAEYERAKIMERNRRGKLHAARSGSVNVLGGAPYGYRYISKHQGAGQAHYEVVADEARVVRQVFDWVGRERLSIGEVCRRLMQAGELTRTGRTLWDRSVVWEMLKNPAYMGSAAFGKTRQGPLRPRLRAQRGKPLQPRQATSVYDVPREDWILIPVPALVEPAVFEAVQSQLEENRRHARQSRRGARYLLQGLLQCQHCGYAFYGKPLSPSSRKNRPRAYAYYRCLGTDAYRFGGERICPNTQVRTDRLELAVWHEVCALLARPERLRQEFERRRQATGESQRQERSALEAQVSKLRQGVSRLIDSYTEGLIDKDEFEPRVMRLRQRLAHIEEQCEALAGEETLERELHLIVSRLDDFATQVGHHLDDLEWAKKREIIRALVRRVEIGLEQVQVVFRVDSFPGESDSEKKSLQLCRGSMRRALRCTCLRLDHQPFCEYPGLQIIPDQFEESLIRDALSQVAHQTIMADLIEKLLQIDIHHHVITLFNIDLGLGHRLVGTSPWTKAITELGKRRIPAPLKHLENRLLDQPVNCTRYTQFAFLLASRLRYVDPFDHLRLVSTVKQLVFDFRPMHLQEVGQLVDVHAIDTRTSLIGADLFERGVQIMALEHFFHQMLTAHCVFGGLSRCKRITPRSGSPGLHPSFPVKGHLNGFAGFRIAHKIKLLLTSPYRSGLQYQGGTYYALC